MKTDDKLPPLSAADTGADASSGLPPASPPPKPQPSPHDRAAAALKACTIPANPRVTLNDMREELAAQIEGGGDERLKLIAQAQVLDAMFNRVMLRSLTGTTWKGEIDPNHLSERDVDLALRIQRQCRIVFRALKTLNEKNSCDQTNDSR